MLPVIRIMGLGMADDGKEMVLRDTRVTADEHGNVCLNDLWALAGSPANRRANDWHRSARAKSLSTALAARITEDSRNEAKSAAGPSYYTAGRGKKQLTFAHPFLALDYAEYLSPELGLEVKSVFLRFRAKDMALALEILDGMSAQAEFDQTRVELRRLLATHNTASAAAAKGAGVKDFAAYNGAGLKGLYGGLTKAQVLVKKGLPPDAHHLDHAGHEELAANYFKATQAEAKLKRDGIQGQGAANAAHEEVGKKVRSTIADLGGTMSEDEPALDNIRSAEKRLKAAGAAPAITGPVSKKGR